MDLIRCTVFDGYARRTVVGFVVDELADGRKVIAELALVEALVLDTPTVLVAAGDAEHLAEAEVAIAALDERVNALEHPIF